MNIDIWLPGLNFSEVPEYYEDIPAFHTIWRWARRQHHQVNTSHMLAPYFSGSLITYFLQELDLPSDTPAMLFAPTVQYVQFHSINLLAGEIITLDTTTAHQFANALNQTLLNSDGMHAHVITPDLWLVTLPKKLQFEAPSVWDIAGQVSSETGITGQDANLLLRLQTEIQMFFTTHSINLQRREQGLPEINGAWLWADSIGNGQAKHKTLLNIPNLKWLPETSPHVYIYTPETWSSLSYLASQFKCSNIFIYRSELESATLNNDRHAHHQCMLELDQKLFSPILEAVKQGIVQHFSISSQAEHGGTLHYGKFSQLAVWRAFLRRQKPYIGQWL